MSASQPDFFSVLPNELFWQILANISDLDDIMRYMKTSPRFREAAEVAVHTITSSSNRYLPYRTIENFKNLHVVEPPILVESPGELNDLMDKRLVSYKVHIQFSPFQARNVATILESWASTDDFHDAVVTITDKEFMSLVHGSLELALSPTLRVDKMNRERISEALKHLNYEELTLGYPNNKQILLILADTCVPKLALRQNTQDLAASFIKSRNCQTPLSITCIDCSDTSVNSDTVVDKRTVTKSKLRGNRTNRKSRPLDVDSMFDSFSDTVTIQ